MAKGQKKSNKEIRKPKAAKPKVESAAQTPFPRSQPMPGSGRKS